MKFKIELGITETVYVRMDALNQIKKYLESARYWKSEGETELCHDFLRSAAVYRNIVKAIDNKIW